MIDMAKAIHAINPSAEFQYSENDFSTLTWLNGTTPISQADIEAKQAELQAEYDAKQYARDREKEYPTWQDQLDDIYHNGIDGWKATIKVTKDKYPKP
ncbi:hypothetical protein [uncultured Mediterranean phage]|nr:hypothetical protein [uncultured Mediterranean phage]